MNIIYNYKYPHVKEAEVTHCSFSKYIHNPSFENERAPVTISKKQENRESTR